MDGRAVTTVATLTGTQKAAIFLLQIGRERSAKVLRTMRESEVADVMAAIARLRLVDTEVVDEVLTEFTTIAGPQMAITSGGLDLARAMLEEAIGPDKASELVDRITAGMIDMPFEFIRKADPRQVLSFLQDEHPQTITLVLAHMPPERAAMVLSGLNEALQREVSHRLAVMDQTSPDVIEQVERVLERKLSSVLQPTELSEVGGVGSLIEILNRSDRATERLILEGLERQDPELADEVRQRMFVFEDITTLDDKAIQLILRQVDSKDLAVALKGVKAEVRQKIMKNLSERAAQNLAEEIELLGPVRLKAVGDAQGAIVRVIRTLEESGQLTLVRSAEEFVE
jgi:flagellar motor switch protein FliG